MQYNPIFDFLYQLLYRLTYNLLLIAPILYVLLLLLGLTFLALPMDPIIIRNGADVARQQRRRRPELPAGWRNFSSQEGGAANQNLLLFDASSFEEASREVSAEESRYYFENGRPGRSARRGSV